MDRKFAVSRNDIFKLNKLTDEKLDEFLAEERSKLKSISCSCRYRSCTKLLKAFMRLFSYELTRDNKRSTNLEEEAEGGVKNVIGFQFLSKESGKSATIYLIDRIVKPFCIALSIYCALKWFTLAALKLERDQLVADLYSTGATSSNEGALNGCTSRAKLAEASPSLKRLNQLDYWLELLADPLISVQGMACLVFFLFAVLICYCFSIGNFIRLTRSRVEFLSFIFDYLGERESTRNEIASMIDSLIESKRYCEYRQNSSTCYQRNVQRSIGSTRGQSKQVSNNGSAYLDYQCHRQNHYLDDLYLSILVEKRLQDLVQPYIQSSKWLRIKIVYEHYLLIVVVASTVLAAWIASSFLFAAELFFRVEHRSKEEACKQWHPDGVPVIGGFHLAPLESMQERQAYQENRGGLGSLARLMLIEAGYLLTPAKLISVVEFLATSLFALASSGFSYSLFVWSQMDQIMWIRQIEAQLEECILMMEASGTRRRLTGSKRPFSGGQSSATGFVVWLDEPEVATIPPIAHSELDNLIKSLTVTFLNYELFKRRQSNYRRLINFILSQLAVLVAGMLIVCYLAGTNIKNIDKRILLFAATFLVFLLNVYMFLAATKMRYVGRVIAKMMKLIARAASLSMQQSQMIALWHRQILNEREAEQLFSSSVFTIYVSYNKIITLNGYLMILWIVLIRMMK